MGIILRLAAERRNWAAYFSPETEKNMGLRPIFFFGGGGGVFFKNIRVFAKEEQIFFRSATGALRGAAYRLRLCFAPAQMEPANIWKP